MVRGGDGKEYGPVSLEHLKTWIKEGRLTPKQEVKRSDMSQWVASGEFTELQPFFTESSSATASTPASSNIGLAGTATAGRADPTLYVHMKSGASWFYWIAALSLINSISAYVGAGFKFIFGLGLTQFLYATMDSGMALILNVLAAGTLVLFGVFANKGQAWAFMLGMVLFALDGIFLFRREEWIGVGLHVLVLYFVGRGFMACRKLKPA
jgi:hypothetical protein